MLLRLMRLLVFSNLILAFSLVPFRKSLVNIKAKRSRCADTQLFGAEDSNESNASLDSPVSFTLKDHTYCHKTKRHVSNMEYLQGTEISYSGPSSPSMLIHWHEQPRTVFLLAKDDDELLSYSFEAMLYLMSKNVEVVMEEKLLKHLIYYEPFVQWLNEYRKQNTNGNTNVNLDRSKTASEPSPSKGNTNGNVDRNNKKLVTTNLRKNEAINNTSYNKKDIFEDVDEAMEEEDFYIISEVYENDKEVELDSDGVVREDNADLVGSLESDEDSFLSSIHNLHPQLSIFTETSQNIDLIITFGGDGLLLYVNTLFQSRAIPPVMCFDFGSLGFLTPFQYEQFREEVDEVLNGTALVTLRMRLECTIFRYNQSRGVYHVLNEAVIDRGPSPFLSVLDLSCDSQYLTTLQGDGVIFATPTGSTAYSLAAGGSIIYPAVPAILLTPICAHSLSFRPMVLPDSAVLTCEVPRECRASGWVSFDGKYRQELHRGNKLQVRLSSYPMPTINKKSFTGDWFDALRAGFMFNIRPRQKPR